MDIPTCLVFKTPVHGKSSVDGAHTAINTYLRKASCYNLASSIPDAIKYCKEQEQQKEEDRDDKDEFQEGFIKKYKFSVFKEIATRLLGA